MSRRTVAWMRVARIAWLVGIVLAAGTFLVGTPLRFAHLQTMCAAEPCGVLQLTPHDVGVLAALGVSVYAYALFHTLATIGFTLVWTVVGLLIFWRQPDDWMALLVAVFLIGFGLLNADPSSLAGEMYPVLRLPLLVINLTTFICFYLFLFLFPNGRFVPRWIRWYALVAIAMVTPSALLSEPVVTQNTWLGVLRDIGAGGYFLVGTFAQIYRYRRVSTSRERQQTKWVVYGITTALFGFVTIVLLSGLVFRNDASFLANQLIQIAFYLCFPIIPLSIGVAILRARLYDIDVIINRTLVYGTLTVMVAAIYFGSVIVLQALVGAVTGQANQPPIVIVGSTLAIAALFNPLRRRIQSIIDRRFYRRKYDAQRTLQAFSVKLREETDLEQLSDDLIEVVQETMQPAHVSLWLRAPSK